MIDGSWVQKTAYGIFTYVLRQITGEWSNEAWQWFSRFFSAPVAVLESPLVQTLVRVGVVVSLACLPALVAFSAVRESLARMDGSSITPPESLIRRAILAGMAVTGTSTVTWFMVQLAEQARNLLAAVGLEINLLHQYFGDPLNPVSTVLLLSLAFVVGAVLLTIQRWVITAEFTTLLIIGPIMAVGLIREGGNTTWNVWLREMVSLLITPLVQMIVILVFLRTFGSAAGVLQTGDRLAALAFLYVLWKTPGWARQMVYHVGSIEDGFAGGMTVGRMMVMRHILRAAVKV